MNDPTDQATHCLECGVEVTLDSVIPTLGACGPCHERYLALRDGDSRLSRRAWILAYFSPGFATDLTSWETCIYIDGKLTQTISWWGRNKNKEEVLKSLPSDEGILKILDAVQQIDRLGVALLNQHFCVDDAEHVTIIVPEIGFAASVALYTFSHSTHRETIPERALSGLESFRRAWDLIDAVTPYNISMHWQRD